MCVQQSRGDLQEHSFASTPCSSSVDKYIAQHMSHQERKETVWFSQNLSSAKFSTKCVGGFWHSFSQDTKQRPRVAWCENHVAKITFSWRPYTNLRSATLSGVDFFFCGLAVSSTWWRWGHLRNMQVFGWLTALLRQDLKVCPKSVCKLRSNGFPVEDEWHYYRHQDPDIQEEGEPCQYYQRVVLRRLWSLPNWNQLAV